MWPETLEAQRADASFARPKSLEAQRAGASEAQGKPTRLAAVLPWVGDTKNRALPQRGRADLGRAPMRAKRVSGTQHCVPKRGQA